MGHSVWSTSEHIKMLVFGKVVSYMVLLELLEDQHHHQMTVMRKLKKIDFGVLSGPRVDLAIVNYPPIYLNLVSCILEAVHLIMLIIITYVCCSIEEQLTARFIIRYERTVLQ